METLKRPLFLVLVFSFLILSEAKVYAQNSQSDFNPKTLELSQKISSDVNRKSNLSIAVIEFSDING